jgi:microcin C transport system substrate-binding protein
VFELLDDTGDSAAMAPVAAAFGRNLQKLGIAMRVRSLDYALIQKRIDAFDFDMTAVRLPDVQVPGTEQVSRFGSRYADEPGSDNLLGVKSPAIDAIVAKIVAAQTREQLAAATHALDRVLINGWYVIPHWYSPYHRIAYRNTLGYPATLPLYYVADEWVLSTWWEKSTR